MSGSVIFNLADGTEVSNDPAFRYKAFQEQQKAQQEALAALNGDATSTAPTSTPGVEDEIPADTDEFDAMSGKELKAYAEENEIDLNGLRKVGEVRDLLRERKAQAEAAASDNDEDED